MKAQLLFLSLLSLACGDDSALEPASSDYLYENPLFAGAALISAQVQPGAQPGRPSFSWPASSYRHVICAIFDERLNLKDGVISNPHRIRWIWHSGLSGGREGQLLFEHGISNAELESPPETLPEGDYYWAVWALDAQGVPQASSQEYTLQIPIQNEVGQ